MANKRILVVGGAGYIGRALVRKLTGSFEVVLLDRKKPIGEGPEFIVCDLLDRQNLFRKVEGFDIVVNLASVVRTVRKRKYKENLAGLSNLIWAMEKRKMKKMVYFSTQNVNLSDKGPYAKSKEDAEKILKNSNLDYMIIRPNYVYEIGKNNYFYKIIKSISQFDIALVVGPGENRIQPVLREDLVNIVFDLVKNFKPKSVFEISGKETVTINQVVRRISKSLKKKPLVIHLPIKAAGLFNFLIPFDLEGFAEDRVSENPYKGYQFSSFYDNLDKIIRGGFS